LPRGVALLALHVLGALNKKTGVIKKHLTAELQIGMWTKHQQLKHAFDLDI
jgi:hypothetical protein